MNVCIMDWAGVDGRNAVNWASVNEEARGRAEIFFVQNI